MAEAARRLHGLDPRLKLGWALAAGWFIWRGGAFGLAAWIVALSILAVFLRPFWRGMSGIWRSGVLFALFWGALKAGLLWLDDLPFPDILGQASLLTMRLFALVLLGLTLALSTPPRQCGLALSWTGRPFFGRRSWEPALALTLMIHFLPQCWRVMSAVRRSLEQRCRRVSFMRRWTLFASAVLRALGRRTWEQTLAVASRGLDEPQAWAAGFDPPDRSWLKAAMLLALLGALSFL
ncbi:MAG: cobalt transporter [Desulfovibrio aminophilus]|uniref:cobalt transporter n=1 Tax=Desulfovibrio aminophilus TaxID=81425 RepID=UPI0039E8A274